MDSPVDMHTDYMGLKLPHPFVAGASPLGDDLDNARRVEDGGAAALVMRSLFAEQIALESYGAYFGGEHMRAASESGRFILSPQAYAVTPDAYLAQLAALKAALRIPVIASLNGTRPGPWLDYAPLVEAVGADALELNLQPGGGEVTRSSADIEADLVETVRLVRAAVKIPVAVKVPACFAGFALFAAALEKAGASALVLFHRAQAPDIDPTSLTTVPPLQLSRHTELPLRLRWVAILSCRLGIPLAVTGGVHEETAAVKALLAGACVVQMVSAILARGPKHLGDVRRATGEWMAQHGYKSLDTMRGSMDLEACPDAAAYERATAILALQRFPVSG
jgi:dihydroorotate dehydrogenase (fumarate)